MLDGIGFDLHIASMDSFATDHRARTEKRLEATADPVPATATGTDSCYK
jgi:hypothetical protein